MGSMIGDLALEPVGSDFDLAAIRGYLDSLKTAVVDPVNPEQYLLSSDPKTLRDGLRQRRDEPSRVPYTLTVIFPKPSCVLIGIRSKDTGPARSFVQWLRARHPTRVLDQEFNDFTKDADASLDLIFGPPSEVP